MEHGLLSPERARKAFEKKHRKQKQIKMRIPVKSPTLAAASNPESYVKQQQQGSKNGEIKAKKWISYDRYDDYTANPRRIKA
ncbi:hypothetical protein Nepgr_000914 [Nepenthes gracilis]|uniref:Uncharacterized protein n=1 Tax=Nepenthes gracilis TaxID=150966 RepID=A0AAD3RXB8_NEPGR|nr:hypothetical protein Nepgr_000914 [Nepenthes gracilis]